METKKGNIPRNKGIPRTEVEKKKIADSIKNKNFR